MNKKEYKYPSKIYFQSMANSDLEREMESVLCFVKNTRYIHKDVKCITIEFEDGLQYRISTVPQDMAVVDLNVLRELAEKSSLFPRAVYSRERLQDVIDNAKPVV